MGGEITIADLTASRADYPDIASELIKNGYRVRNFTSTGVSLEEYFITLVGGSL